MDISKRLNSVNTLNDYIELSQALENGHEKFKIVLNMSTVLSLKKIRSLEIEYFNKCDGSGAAFKLFEQVLCAPPSKTWGLLGSDLISLLQYWLDAVRKHMISHHIHWWTFLKRILEFIKDTRLKDESLSNMLVEETAESMLDLATSGKPDVNQRYEILHTFNLYCAESSREVRLAMRTRLEPYLIRVATVIATCGHLPLQFASVEALLRWLQPRHEPRVRSEAAALWFPPHLYNKRTVDIFLTRTWYNFIQDARDFLNSHNESSNLVTSVVCRKLAVGITVIVTGKEKRDTWLDVNSGGSCVSALLEPAQQPGGRAAACRPLALSALHTASVMLHRESSEIRLSIATLEPPSILPESAPLFERETTISLVVSSHSDLARLDAALRAVFQDKYQLLLDIQEKLDLSPSKPGRGSRRNSMEEKARLSNQAKENRRRHCGYMVRSRNLASLKSPSTASTTSLAQLHDKLSALPYYEFTKEPLTVCARPELSIVSEQNESEITNSLESTLKLGRCAVFDKTFLAYIEERKSQSDGETAKLNNTHTNTCDDQFNEAHKNAKGSQSENEFVKKTVKTNEGRGVSSLFAATIGSADDSVISATIERLPKSKDLNTDNLIELLVQEALHAKGNDEKERLIDSGINTGDKKTPDKEDVETIEDTQFTGFKAKTTKTFTVVSKSTSDESNTEAVNNTPVSFVNVRKRNQRKRSVKKNEPVEKPSENATFDVQAVEDFFNQHYSENELGHLVISPTLAKKINETSSESSEECLLADIDKDFLPDQQMPENEIVQCLNNIVDKVCVNFEKCSQYLNKKGPDANILEMAKNVNVEPKEQMPLQEKNNFTEEPKKRGKQKSTKPKSKAAIKLKFPSKKQNSAKAKGKRKLELEPVSKMSTIIEDTNESMANKTVTPERNKSSTDNDVETPLVRRKRKLYSPKDDDMRFEDNKNDDAASTKPEDAKTDDEEDVALANFKKEKMSTPKLSTPKSTATCYKELEKERQKYKRTRAQRLKAKQSPPSPKTRKLNDDFEKLKDNIESNENIILIDKITDKDKAIYNFTSDSEDEDFKQKKIEIQKRASNTTVGSGTSAISTRRGRAVNKVSYTENAKDSSNEATTKPTRRKIVTKRKTNKSKTREVTITPPKDLVDERMREAGPEIINTSFVEAKNDNIVKEPEPMIQAPELEPILDKTEPIDKRKKVKATKSDKNLNKKREDIQPLTIIRDDDRTVSPLPGLVIETELAKNDGEDSLTTNLEEKLRKICRGGPDTHDDTITTQNMLSDNDRVNSPQVNITRELERAYEKENTNNTKNNTEFKKSDDRNYNSDVIDDTMNSGYETDRSKLEGTRKAKHHKLRLKTKEKAGSFNNSNTVKDDRNNTISKVIDKSIQKEEANKPKIKRKSSIQEIICIDTNIITRSKSISRSKSREVEIVDNTAASTAKSERSIATDGINAHGDINELPPSPKLLDQKFIPREIHDMDQTIREYYVELNRKVNVSKDSNESGSNGKSSEEIKAVQKRNSKDQDSDTSQEHNSDKQEKQHKRINKRDYDIAKWLPSLRGTESENSSQSTKVLSPTVSLAKLTPEDIAKWLPSTKTSPETSFETAKTRGTVRRSPRIASQAKNRKSQISPIQIEDFIVKSKLPNTSKTTDNTMNSKSAVIEQKIDWKTKRYFLRPAHQSSPISRASKTNSSSKQSTKSGSPIAKPIELKRRKLDLDLRPETVEVSESRQSSNVDDWLRKMSNSCTVDNVDASSEALQNLMEKLDTTLAEIHQTTTKDFIGLFVEAHKQLTELKNERRRHYRETALEILNNVTQLIDKQFTELDQRAEERDEQFMTWLKERASAVLRRDCRQKRAMVSLLREDVQAVAEHTGRSRTRDTHD